MSLIGTKRTFTDTQRKVRRFARDNCTVNKVAYNPYTKKLSLTRKHHFTRRIPQFKIRPSQNHRISDWVGDNLQNHPPPHLTRFLLQNCHGLPLMNDTNYFQSLVTNVLVHDVHFMAFPEINANCLNKDLVNGYKDAFSSIVSDGVFLSTNSPVFTKDHKYQPGGVASGFFGRLVTRYINQGRDKYGRWHLVLYFHLILYFHYFSDFHYLIDGAGWNYSAFG